MVLLACAGPGVEPALSINLMRVEKVIPWCEQKVGGYGVGQYEEAASFTFNNTMSTLSL